MENNTVKDIIRVFIQDEIRSHGHSYARYILLTNLVKVIEEIEGEYRPEWYRLVESLKTLIKLENGD
jgi:hypothetical protein